MRRLLAGTAAGLVLLAGASTAAAQDGGSRWAGSKITSPDTSTSGSIIVEARFVREHPSVYDPYADTWITVPAGLPDGCPASGEVALDTNVIAEDSESFTTSTRNDVFEASCNGTYTVRVVGGLTRPPLLPNDEAPPLYGEIEVAVAPPDVPKLAASVEGGKVVLSWSAVTTQAPDFLGYQVERRQPDGAWKLLKAVGPDSRSFTDGDAPLGADDVIYRVRARRAGPHDEVRSPGRTVTVKADGSVTTVPGSDGGTTVPGSDGGTGPGDGSDGGAGGGGAGGGSSNSGSSGPLIRGRTGRGTRAPRLGTPSQANFPPLLTPVDGGFEEEIDYGDRSLAGEEDDLSSVLIDDEEGGRGMVIPVGIGAVLAAWAFHLRFLAKAARPVPVAAAAHGPARRGPDRFVDPFAPAIEVRPAGRPPSLDDRVDPFAFDRPDW